MAHLSRLKNALLRGSEPMSKTLLWIQGGGCGGDTWSFLNSESPDAWQVLKCLGITVLWHPSFSVMTSEKLRALMDKIVSGEQKLDFFCLEGSVIHGPKKTGDFDRMLGRPKKDLILELASKAQYAIAVGTCASFGGIGADSEIQGRGLQFYKHEFGGALGKEFRTKSGMPVINLPGCPCHSDVISGILSELVYAPDDIGLNQQNAPREWFDVMVHQGCTRNEYHEYRIEEKRFGEKGCMFFYMGCSGPLATGTCNKTLWNRRSSKTRVGVPCFGCTRPDFPQPFPFFTTRNIEGIPIDLPAGVSRAHYMAYKGMAAAAAPERLIKRKAGI